MCSDGRWFTTTELHRDYSIRPELALTHAPDLREQNLARRTYPCQRGRGSNPWLFHPDAIEILQARRGSGRPRLEPTEKQELILQSETVQQHKTSVEALRKCFKVSWHVANRWVQERVDAEG